MEAEKILGSHLRTRLLKTEKDLQAAQVLNWANRPMKRIKTNSPPVVKREPNEEKQMAEVVDLKGEVEKLAQLHQKAMDQYERLWLVHLDMVANVKRRLRVRDVRGAYSLLVEAGNFSMLDNAKRESPESSPASSS